MMMDDILFQVLFISISVISGRWKVDNERLCAMKLFTVDPASGDRTLSARSVCQRLTH